MKKLLFLLCPLFFFSCASFRVPVPGETVAKRSNIFAEYMNIADAYNDLGKYDKAVTYYKLAKKSRGLRWTANYKLAHAYAMNKDWNEAQKLYLVLYKRDKQNVSIQMSLAYIYAMNGKLSSAENIYSMLVEKNPENADVLVNYINVLFAMEKYTDAEQNLAVLKEKFKDNTNISAFEKKLEEVTSGGDDETVPEVQSESEQTESLETPEKLESTENK